MSRNRTLEPVRCFVEQLEAAERLLIDSWTAERATNRSSPSLRVRCGCGSGGYGFVCAGDSTDSLLTSSTTTPGKRDNEWDRSRFGISVRGGGSSSGMYVWRDDRNVVMDAQRCATLPDTATEAA